MKLQRILTALILTVALVAPAAQCAAPDTTVYEISLSSKQGNMGSRKMSVKGSYFCWEADAAGVKGKIIKNKDGTFLINPIRSVAAKFAKGARQENPMAMHPGPIGDVRAFLKAQKATLVGKATVDKKPCHIYSYTEKSTGIKCKLWVTTSSSTPVKMEMPTKKDTIVVKYKSYKRGVAVSDSLLNIPAGYKIVDMPKASSNASTKAQ